MFNVSNEIIDRFRKENAKRFAEIERNNNEKIALVAQRRKLRSLRLQIRYDLIDFQNELVASGLI
jgi:hypothetical protein